MSCRKSAGAMASATCRERRVTATARRRFLGRRASRMGHREGRGAWVWRAAVCFHVLRGPVPRQAPGAAPRALPVPQKPSLTAGSTAKATARGSNRVSARSTRCHSAVLRTFSAVSRHFVV